MRVNSEEYYKLLAQIKDNNPPRIAPLTDADVLMEIDLNTREINAPQYLSVQDDHLAEVVYFEIDRFYDSYDLLNSIGVIEYIDAKGDGHIYSIPYYDIFTKKDKIVFPWCIQGYATNTAGIVEFAVKFYQLNENKELIYCLNTLPAKSRVLRGISRNTINDSEDYYQLANAADQIFSELQSMKRTRDVMWICLT